MKIAGQRDTSASSRPRQNSNALSVNGAPWAICITPPNAQGTQYLYSADAVPGRVYKLTLDGKVLGLLPNWRPSAIHILKSLGELLQERYKLKAVEMAQPMRELPLRAGKLLDPMQEQLDSMVGRVDIALVASGD